MSMAVFAERDAQRTAGEAERCRLPDSRKCLTAFRGDLLAERLAEWRGWVQMGDFMLSRKLLGFGW